MKAVIAVIIYDRINNLKRWLEIWKKVSHLGVELRVIHNLHPNHRQDNFRKLVEDAGAVYIPRDNVGMDIGAFQDVCRSRLTGFKNDFNYLLWFTDDTFPMDENFVSKFTILLENNQAIGLTCYEISNQVKKHVRTTGFCLRRETLSQIIFDVEKIQTKEQCYHFEHKSENNLHNQIIRLGMQAIQISPIASSPVWDSGGGGVQWVDRLRELLLYWKLDFPPAKVIVIAPAFLRYPTIVPSMLSQTHQNWELHLVHAGPAPHDYPRFTDERIKFFEMSTNRQNYGHPIRIDWLNKVKAKQITGDYVVVTNDDNYHVPHFLEKLVRPLERDPSLIGSYCSMMVHTYQGGDGYDLLKPIENGHIDDGYGIIDTKPQQGYIDCAAVMIRAELAGRHGWPSLRHSSDWDYLNIIATSNGGWGKMKKEFGALLVHN